MWSQNSAIFQIHKQLPDYLAFTVAIDELPG